MAESLRILHLEDDPTDARLAMNLLGEAGLQVQAQRVHTFPAFQHALESAPVDLILADYTVPGVDALQALRWARQLRPEVPFVFLAGTLGEERAIETLKLGATDFVLKDRLGRLVPCVRRALREAREQALRQQAEQSLRQLNATLEERVRQRTRELDAANADLQNFAHMAAHDLRSPARALVSYAALLVAHHGPGLDSGARATLERMRQSAEQLERLLHELLQFCRLSQAQVELQPVGLQSAVPEALALLEEEIRSKQAIIRIGEAMPTVLGHHATLVMLVHNLVSNALKFVPQEHQPRIRIHAEPSPLQTGSPHGPGFVRLSVEDNGIGIARGDQEKVFGVFQRLHHPRDYPGSGLGLAIVRKGAERMGGSVGVESQLGQGSHFWLDLLRA